mmetsp:Transcript_8163/g.11767  ORF Transcript_8163/g.11767 Transcript_8163/m.11767 type:complete len:270 (-) Transcript_8163:1825-2634(-)
MVDSYFLKCTFNALPNMYSISDADIPVLVVVVVPAERLVVAAEAGVPKGVATPASRFNIAILPSADGMGIVGPFVPTPLPFDCFAVPFLGFGDLLRAAAFVFLVFFFFSSLLEGIMAAAPVAALVVVFGLGVARLAPTTPVDVTAAAGDVVVLVLPTPNNSIGDKNPDPLRLAGSGSGMGGTGNPGGGIGCMTLGVGGGGGGGGGNVSSAGGTTIFSSAVVVVVVSATEDDPPPETMDPNQFANGFVSLLLVLSAVGDGNKVEDSFMSP